MFSTNNKLIENISKEFNIENNEINNIIKNMFKKIAEIILIKNRFYMDRLGIISINSDNDIIFTDENGSFDESLESINPKNNNIKNIFLEKNIYKSIFKNIKDISKNENVYIENFGTFSYDEIIKFEADDFLKSKIKELNKNEIVEDILDEIDNKIKNDDDDSNDDDSIEEIIENKSIDDNVIGNIWKNKNYKSIMIQNINEKESDENKSEIDNIEEDDTNSQDETKKEDMPEMKEYSEEELLDINHFDKEYLEADNLENNREEIKEVSDDNKSEVKEQLSNINNFINDYLDNNLKYQKKLEDDAKSSYEDLLNINNKTLNIKKLGKNDIEKKEKSKNELFSGIIKVACIIIAVLIIGIILSIYNGSSKNIASNNLKNQKLYDIVNGYFNEINSVNLSYITSKDMYYWDIAKVLYGDATYWPLIYAYNSENYKISNIIRKGSNILYRNIPDFHSIREIKYLNNTISKSYIYIYPILMNDNKINHAIWSLKLSAYYDLNVLKNNANMIPKETYLNILKDNNTIKTTYDELIKYGKLNENMFLSFLELIKDKLGI
ncbi:hypothetical protein [Brachyspira sp.]|uniref:hypothetical protein n=1 Tax=Brachyspira sp. TaxID=1977261 RepID=UPI00260EF012|nr:hypothetical protein [Brachyspira sp.]